MVNLNKLKGKLTENKKSYKEAALILKCSLSTVNNKLNGRAQIDCSEAILLSDWLGLKDEEKLQIFFDKNMTPCVKNKNSA